MSDAIEVLGSQHIATDGPFKLEMNVLLIGLDGDYKDYEAWATVDLAPGQVPDDDAILKVIKAAKAQVGASFRLATREEFVRAILAERTGAAIDFAVPGPREFRLSEALTKEAGQ